MAPLGIMAIEGFSSYNALGQSNGTMMSFDEFIEAYREINNDVEQSLGILATLTENKRLVFFGTFADGALQGLKEQFGISRPTQEQISQFIAEVARSRDIVSKNTGMPETVLGRFVALAHLASSHAMQTLKEDVDLADLNAYDDSEAESALVTPESVMAGHHNRIKERSEFVLTLFRKALYVMFEHASLIDVPVLKANRESFEQHFNEAFDAFLEADLLTIDNIAKLDDRDPRRGVFELCHNEAVRLIEMGEDPTISMHEKQQIVEAAVDKIRITTKNDLLKIMNDIRKTTLRDIRDEEEKARVIQDAVTQAETSADDVVDKEKPKTDEEVNNEAAPEDEQEPAKESPSIEQLVHTEAHIDLVALDMLHNGNGISEAVDRVVDVATRRRPASVDRVVAYSNYLQRKVVERAESRAALSEGTTVDQAPDSDSDYRKRAAKIAVFRETEEGRAFESEDARKTFIDNAIAALRKADRENYAITSTTSTILLNDSMLEAAPPDPEIEKWIVANKAVFQKRYGSRGMGVLYARAWKMFNKKKAAKKKPGTSKPNKPAKAGIVKRLARKEGAAADTADTAETAGEEGYVDYPFGTCCPECEEPTIGQKEDGQYFCTLGHEYSEYESVNIEESVTAQAFAGLNDYHRQQIAEFANTPIRESLFVTVGGLVARGMYEKNRKTISYLDQLRESVGTSFDAVMTETLVSVAIIRVLEAMEMITNQTEVLRIFTRRQTK